MLLSPPFRSACVSREFMLWVAAQALWRAAFHSKAPDLVGPCLSAVTAGPGMPHARAASPGIYTTDMQILPLFPHSETTVKISAVKVWEAC